MVKPQELLRCSVRCMTEWLATLRICDSQQQHHRRCGTTSRCNNKASGVMYTDCHPLS